MPKGSVLFPESKGIEADSGQNTVLTGYFSSKDDARRFDHGALKEDYGGEKNKEKIIEKKLFSAGIETCAGNRSGPRGLVHRSASAGGDGSRALD